MNYSEAFIIALLPEAPLEERVIAASERCGSHEAFFVLGKNQNLSHLTLYSFRGSPAEVDAYSAVIKDVAARFPRVSADAKGYFIDEGYIQIDYGSTDELRKMQEECIGAVASLSPGLREGASAYPFSGGHFRPHITVTRFRENRRDLAAALFPSRPGDYSGSFTAIAVCKAGEHGECLKVVARFELSAAV